MWVVKKSYEKQGTGFSKKCFMLVDHLSFWVYCFYIQHVFIYSNSLEMRRFRDGP